MTPSQAVAVACGVHIRSGSELCWMCSGLTGVDTEVARWVPSSFTGYATVKAPLSKFVCDGCVYIASRMSPVPGRPPKEGKKFGGNFRNYSHLGDLGSMRYTNASKGQKDAIRDFLAVDHKGDWFASVADSGQKHVLPFATVNGPGLSGCVRFEDADVWWGPDGISLISDITKMLSAGVPKAEVLTGDYQSRTYVRAGPAWLRSAEQDLIPLRGSGTFALALWLAQRDTDDPSEKCRWHPIRHT